MIDRDAKQFELICAACGVDFLGTRFQLKRTQEGKPVYCCQECASRRTSYREASGANRPWGHLGVKNIVKELPTEFIEEPYVGY